MFGSNDSKNYQWDEAQFVRDYFEICKKMTKLANKPQVYLAIPPPLYIGQNKFKFNQTVINTRLPELVPEIAEKCGVVKSNVINFFDAMGGHALNMP